jgi:ribosomal protein S12 methylthiotransferase accessory factor
MDTTRPIVFLGPSMTLETARLILHGDYRPPVRRGDLVGLAPGTVVALIDGVFGQDLAVSLREVQDAVDRGVVVFGGASMGALRAVEVPAVIGVGRIYEWYRAGQIRRDDEVALLFDEVSGQALTVPTVNVRFAVERLARMGTIDRPTADAILAAAIELPYVERTYPAILSAAGIAGRADTGDLIGMLLAHDLKRLDAQAVLEAVSSYCSAPAPPTDPAPAASAALPEAEGSGVLSTGGDRILIWESGDCVGFGELVEFLAFTGRLEPIIRRVMTSGALERACPAPDGPLRGGAAQELFVAAVRRWGWMSPEEADITLADLGLQLASVDRYLAAVVASGVAAAANARTPSPDLLSALRVELFLEDMALKREAMRRASLFLFAEAAGEPPHAEDLRAARAVLCKANGADTPATLERRWGALGLAPSAQAAFIDVVARARRVARPLAERMNGRANRCTHQRATVMPFVSCPKPPGEPRFSRTLVESIHEARRIADIIAVTRIGFIGELSELGGVQIAQVARPGGAWSSSYGSGKALTKDGAIVGGVMEEVEKWSQERFSPEESSTVSGSYLELGSDERFISPARLDLPYDSSYRPDRSLRWHPCADILLGGEVYIPLDVLTMRRLPHDICFSQRGARKHLATNGLGSAFSLEEAVLHGMCEYIERHALRLAELFLVNPGGLGAHPYRLVNIASASERIRELVGRLSSKGSVVKVLDIMSDVAVPTFLTVIIREGRRAEGSATHPDVETAIEMSMLEAAQTIASAIAGAREDLSIRARSLGRHERPRPVTVDDLWFWLDPDALSSPVQEIHGYSTADVRDEVEWVLDRLREAGLVNCCVLDLSRDEVAPARVVRVIIPELESNNPFFTGERARLVLLRDLLPRWR